MEGTFELRSNRPNLVPLLATRCLYWGVHLKTKDSLLQTEDVLLKTKDSLLKTEDNRKWVEVNQTQLSTTFGPLDVSPGVHMGSGQLDLI